MFEGFFYPCFCANFTKPKSSFLYYTSSTRTSRGRKFPPLKKKHKPIRTLGPIEKNHPPALSLTCLLLWSRQRMCWMTIPRTPSKYSVKCVLSLDVQCRFRNEFTSVLLGNVIEQGNAWLLSRQRIFCLHLSNARA